MIRSTSGCNQTTCDEEPLRAVCCRQLSLGPIFQGLYRFLASVVRSVLSSFFHSLRSLTSGSVPLFLLLSFTPGLVATCVPGHVATRLVRPSLPLRAGRVADRSGVGTERPRNPTDLMYEWLRRKPRHDANRITILFTFCTVGIFSHLSLSTPAALFIEFHSQLNGEDSYREGRQDDCYHKLRTNNRLENLIYDNIRLFQLQSWLYLSYFHGFLGWA